MSNPEMNNQQQSQQTQQTQTQQSAAPQRKAPFSGMGNAFANMKMQTLLIVLGVVTAVVIFFQIYFSLMAFSIYNIGLRIGLIVLLLIWSIPLLVCYLRNRKKETKKMKAFNKVHWGWKIPAGIAVVLTVVSLCLAIFTTPMFMAKQYNSMITVSTKTGTAEEPYKEFTEEVDDFYNDEMKVAIIDEKFASLLGEKVLGEGSGGYASQYLVRDYTLIHYNDSLYWVGALEPKGFFQWTSSAKTGTPGYVLVDATQTGDKAKAELVTKYNLKYTPGAYLWNDAERQMYFSNMTAMRESRLNFEIDDQGVPYYTQAIYKKKFGITSGDDVIGLITMNAVNGECKSYEVDKVPAWIDNVQSPNFTMKQLNYWGEYSHGYFNTWFAKKEVNNTTVGHNYVYNKGRLYITTGITAKASDNNAIVGMVLSDMRTKQTTMYNMVGATEQAAMQSAQGIQEASAAGYTATFPTLINFNGVPTFYMALKDKGGNIKMYAYVNVEEYTSKLAAAATPEAAKAKYNEMIKDDIPDKPILPEGEEKTGQISFVKDFVKDGNTMFLITVGGVDYEVSVKVKGATKLLKANAGQNITFRIKNGNITEILNIA